MEKRSNMKQAMYEMFGVGSDQNVNQETEATTVEDLLQAEHLIPESQEAAPVVKKSTTFIAHDCVFHGTLTSSGNVEVEGEFKGDITAEGIVTLRSDYVGNVTSEGLKLYDSTLDGDVKVKTALTISENAEVYGNISAKELYCAGLINGDLEIGEHTTLDGSARVKGDIQTGTLSVNKGAVIEGCIKTNATKK